MPKNQTSTRLFMLSTTMVELLAKTDIWLSRLYLAAPAIMTAMLGEAELL